jgi:hypothetical protein
MSTPSTRWPGAVAKLLSLRIMLRTPEDYTSAVDLLLEQCPEFRPAWDHLCEWCEED